jgi:predicted NBD/HSP70 family sugar kinase
MARAIDDAKLGQMTLIAPRSVPPLDDGFRPAVLANHAYTDQAKKSNQSVPLILSLERTGGAVSRFETVAYPEDHAAAGESVAYAERLVKFLLWQRGGWRVTVGGPAYIGKAIEQIYSAQGERAFDAQFMGEDVYEKPFTVTTCQPDDVPAQHELEKSLGRHLDGCRIGFDLGASDLKVSAVENGKAIFSTEIEWNPREQTDPAYHYEKILDAIKLAASKLPKVDAIGGSSAGVYIDNRPMIASLFRGIPKERFGEVRSLFERIQREFGVPLDIANDGEVTALAGSMSLEDNGVLGIALGSSEAAGYVTLNGNITDWLNELAFAPVDYSPNAPRDEWSGDAGVGSQYFSQQCVFRLVGKAGIEIPADLSNARKLEVVQEKLEGGHEGARKIWESMAVYMGYALAHYADFYALKHVLILGRCTSGSGGQLILDGAMDVLKREFPEIAAGIKVQLPDEKSRRVGQSIAAASLPAI